jgi:hypothetical protein
LKRKKERKGRGEGGQEIASFPCCRNEDKNNSGSVSQAIVSKKIETFLLEETKQGGAFFLTFSFFATAIVLFSAIIYGKNVLLPIRNGDKAELWQT